MDYTCLDTQQPLDRSAGNDRLPFLSRLLSRNQAQSTSKLEILTLSVVWSNGPIEDLRNLRRYLAPLGLLLPGFDFIIRVAGLPDFPGFPGLTEDTIIEQ